MSMREGESVKAYVERYWEMFNEIDGDFDEVAIRTFKVGLPPEHGLRKSLTGKPVTSLRQLMDRVDKYKRIEDDQQQEKWKAKVIPQERRDSRSDRQQQPAEKGLCRADRIKQQPGCRSCLPRASASSFGKSQERVFL